MLTKPMKKYVMNETKNGYTKETQNIYNNRIKTYAAKALEDLTLLAQKLPEEQQAKIFNRENLNEFFKALFNFPPASSLEDYTNPPEEIQDRIDRLLPICYAVITCLNDRNFASRIAYNFYDVLRHEGGPLCGLRAVYYRSLNQTPHKKRYKPKQDREKANLPSQPCKPPSPALRLPEGL